MINFKTVTLELYNQDVIIIFKPETECYRKHGPVLEGKLAGRIWGERFDDESHTSSVIGIIIKTATDDVNVSCQEIEDIKKL